MTSTAWVKEISGHELDPISGGRGRWKRWVSLPKAESGMIFGMGELQVGEASPYHAHPEPEIFFVLSGLGKARWQEGDREREEELRPGLAFFSPGGMSHQIINLGGTPLTGLFFKVDK
jgi:mannose-6-phosphate isomerase-like protein (cupin superfamily)